MKIYCSNTYLAFVYLLDVNKKYLFSISCNTNTHTQQTYIYVLEIKDGVIVQMFHHLRLSTRAFISLYMQTDENTSWMQLSTMHFVQINNHMENVFHVLTFIYSFIFGAWYIQTHTRFVLKMMHYIPLLLLFLLVCLVFSLLHIRTHPCFIWRHIIFKTRGYRDDTTTQTLYYIYTFMQIHKWALFSKMNTAKIINAFNECVLVLSGF